MNTLDTRRPRDPWLSDIVLRATASAVAQSRVALAKTNESLKKLAAETELHLWRERLAEQRMYASRETSLEMALDAAMSVASADCANIQLLHPSGRGLVLKAQRGFRQPFLDFFEFVDDDHTACGVALREQRSVIVEDIINSPIFVYTSGLDVMLEAGIRAVKSTPLIGRAGQVLGMVSVHYRRPRAHVDSGVARFQALAAAIGALIDRS
jgi:GAF domain-containing protein